jgi:hypothetical protein
MLGGIVVGLTGTIARPNRHESDDGLIHLGNQHDAGELATPLKHEVQVGVGNVLARWQPRVEVPLEILQLDEAESDSLAIAQRIELSDLHRTQAANAWLDGAARYHRLPSINHAP